MLRGSGRSQDPDHSRVTQLQSVAAYDRCHLKGSSLGDVRNVRSSHSERCPGYAFGICQHNPGRLQGTSARRETNRLICKPFAAAVRDECEQLDGLTFW